ncbi:MAG: hypothetical protein U0R80_07990 [Nocardioidaceae bacterium]
MIRALPPADREPITFDQAVDDVEHLAREVLDLARADALFVTAEDLEFTARRLVQLARGLRIAAAPLLSGEVAR